MCMSFFCSNFAPEMMCILYIWAWLLLGTQPINNHSEILVAATSNDCIGQVDYTTTMGIGGKTNNGITFHSAKSFSSNQHNYNRLYNSIKLIKSSYRKTPVRVRTAIKETCPFCVNICKEYYVYGLRRILC